MGALYVHAVVGLSRSLGVIVGTKGATRTPSPSTPTPSPSPSPSVPVPSDSPTGEAEAAVKATVSAIGVLGAVAIGFLIGIIAAIVIQVIGRLIVRRNAMARAAAHPAVRPLRAALAVAGAWAGMLLASPQNPGESEPHWRELAQHGFLILCIASLTWLVSNIVLGIQDVLLSRLRETGKSRYRKVQTQLQILNRITTVTIWLLGMAAILMTFPLARAAGTSVFASAGLFSVVAGIAAQSSLGNFFAGLQLAFSDSIRVGDIVIWKTEYTKVEEITLTYVVLKVWDGRRLIVPSKELTTQTFENWTRRTPDMLGYVDFQLDWSVPIPQLRAELDRILSATDLWDGETGIIQVRTSEGTSLQVSALVSAKSPSELVDLKFYVRERLVRWIQANAPDAIPHSRSFSDPDPLAEVPEGDAQAAKLLAGEGAAQTGAFPASGKGPGSGADSGAAGYGAGFTDAWKALEAKDAKSGVAGQSRAARSKLDKAKEQLAAATEDANRRAAEKEAAGRRGGSQAGGAGRGRAASPAAATEVIAYGLSESGGPLPASGQSGLAQTERISSVPPELMETGYESSIFSGSAGAEKRAREFSGPGEDALRERDEAAWRKEARETGHSAGESERERRHKRASMTETAIYNVDDIASQAEVEARETGVQGGLGPDSPRDGESKHVRK